MRYDYCIHKKYFKGKKSFRNFEPDKLFVLPIWIWKSFCFFLNSLFLSFQHSLKNRSVGKNDGPSTWLVSFLGCFHRYLSASTSLWSWATNLGTRQNVRKMKAIRIRSLSTFEESVEMTKYFVMKLGKHINFISSWQHELRSKDTSERTSAFYLYIGIRITFLLFTFVYQLHKIKWQRTFNLKL